MVSESKVVREKSVPSGKVELVAETVEKLKNFKTILIASCKGLPSSQFQEIKKKLRGKSEVKFMKKSAFSRAINASEKGALQELKKEVSSDFAVFFSNLDAFELSALLIEKQVPTKAKPGDIAPYDIHIEPGPTELVPGPAISELGSVGLKVSVKDGKLEIQKGATVVKQGEAINEKVASVLGKLNIMPIKVGFLPLAAYDSEADKVYVGIKIDKEGTLEELRALIGKAINLAINVDYPTDKTISYFIAKATNEEKALARLIEEKSGSSPEPEQKAENVAEEVKAEENVQETTKEESQ